MITVKIISTGDSSRKYGLCEICKTHAGEMYHLFNYQIVPQVSKWGHLECLHSYAKKKGYQIIDKEES